MALPLAVPVVVGLGRLGMLGYRAYQGYRIARAAEAATAAAEAALAAERARKAAQLAAAAAAAQKLAQTKARDEPCDDCPCQRTVVISRAASPKAAQHIVDAQALGQPSVLTLDRPGTSARRAASLRGIPTKPGMDRDEYPPATFAEGGAGASVRHIPRSDNRSAGGQIGAQLAGAPDGCKITMAVGP
ncbi:MULTISPECIES: NucA/NucB deoxyribonuclease domain-containing protein [Agrobacterium]|uniref:Sporulation-specific extracellular nuclease n=1 Tax=Agrobacterium rosae TaxID=1972867 RepID=A0A1R3TBM3_9HYPH|nr:MULTISPECIES: NucA/NucB deoxyribonuclease domain-containing protein [Agrobacterium]SCX09156.1 Sporulation-specific extracellular nuclease precursor [Agrobacterium rosae]SCX19027.1 Sporulation-specific extracellular nuclease precursor [Agrobacterium sp. DSM 25558]